MLIGKRLKQLREEHKMTLKELSEKCGVQIATLSRIENLKMTGTLESHMNIAKALGVDITEFYKDVAITEAEKKYITKTSLSPTESFAYNEKASYEILASNVLAKRMLPVILRIEPGGRTNDEQNQPGAEKFLFILEGEITAYIGDKTYHLPKNHTLYFDASLKHYFVNAGKHTVKLIAVVTTVAL